MASGRLKSKWCVSVNAKICRNVVSDPEAGQLAAMFGLSGRHVETLYDQFRLTIEPGQIIAVIGPSGAGKSVLLNRIVAQVLDAIVLRTAQLSGCERAAVSILSGGSLRERLKVLSRCGLAEAAALVTSARSLSGGQLYRLALAEALHRACRQNAPTLVVADEFASTLDAVTASLLCMQIRKWISRSSIALVLATPRVELLELLRPDRVLVKPIGEAVRVHGRGRIESVSLTRNFKPRIVRGKIGDYRELAGFHYLAGAPATHKRVYAVRCPRRLRSIGMGRIAAVLVVSPPLANVRGRNLATDGRYSGPDRSAAMTLLNEEVESISRVIVHPVFRGCGLAVRLVRHAIARAETPLIEALAAMGAVHPFFELAAMRAVPVEQDRHIARFISAAEAVGLDRRTLPAVEPVRALLSRKDAPAARFLREELEHCLTRIFSPAQRDRLDDPVGELCRRTARQYVYYLTDTPRLASSPVADLPFLKERSPCPKK